MVIIRERIEHKDRWAFRRIDDAWSEKPDLEKIARQTKGRIGPFTEELSKMLGIVLTEEQVNHYFRVLCYKDFNDWYNKWIKTDSS